MKSALGRPRTFDREKALEAAMRVFWQTGYETSSISDLTDAMGISPPSLYAAFGDKENLFFEAMRRYTGDPAAIIVAIEEAPAAFEAARRYLMAAAAAYTRRSMPKGCLIASASATGSDASRAVRQAATGFRNSVRKALQKRIELDVKLETLPATTNAAALSSFVMTIGQGMSTIARDGASRSELRQIVETALRAWPIARR